MGGVVIPNYADPAITLRNVCGDLNWVMAPTNESQAKLYRMGAILIAGLVFLLSSVLLDAVPGSLREELLPPSAALVFGAYIFWFGMTYLSRRALRHIGEFLLLPATFLVVHNGIDAHTANLAPEFLAGPLIGFILQALVLQKKELIWIWCALNALTVAIVVLLNAQSPHVLGYTLTMGSTIVTLGFLSAARLEKTSYEQRHAHFTQTVFDHSPDLLLYGSFTTGKIFATNKAAERMFETSDWTLIADLIRQAYLLNHPDEDPRELLVRAFSGEQWVETVKFKTARGNIFWGNLAMGRLGAQEDTIMVRVTDITEMHKQNQALAEARDAAEHAMAVRTRFLANMSHEIRTPMNGVIGMTSLLLNTDMSQEQSSYVETIRSSGESLLTIINDILDFSKIEAGHVDLEHQVFDLEHCVADAVDIVSPIAANKGLELVLDMQVEDTLHVRGDVQRLRQVLVNLLSNAIKFTERGEIVLRVRRSEIPQDSNQPTVLYFDVQDTGIGIPEDTIPRLFEAFTQADASTTRRFGGTGLGLSICKSLVNLMGGDISAESVEGEGSTFRFSVNVDFEGFKHDTPEVDLHARSVFAVDDNETNRTVLTGLLNSFGLTVKTFASANELASALRHTKPDLIISDMAMPDTDGLQLTINLRQEHETLPPIILLTSLDYSESDAAQFERVLRKPVRPTDLRRALVNALVPQNTSTPTQTARNAPSTSMQLKVLEGQTVLVAEDNVVNQKVARNMLKKLGVNVDIAADGREAVEMMQQRGYDLIFMDMQMPEMDGIAATRLIREGDYKHQPYIIAMTANALPEDRQACLDSGMNDFVAKPVRIQDMRMSLERAFASDTPAQA